MIQHSYISDKKISKSLTKLNRISSDNRFRVKSLRMKTQQKTKFDLQSPTKQKVKFPLLSNTSSAKHITSLRLVSATKETESSQIDALLKSKLRIKSTLLEKDYENQLVEKLKFSQEWLREIFTLKLQHEGIKPTDDKYLQFCKMMYTKLNDKVQLSVDALNLKGRALERFLECFIQWKDKQIISIDLSYCSELSVEVRTKEQSQLQQITKNTSSSQIGQQSLLWPMNSLLPRLITVDQQLLKLCIRNIHLSPQQMLQLLTLCLKSKRIYSLDISNKSSQTINRLGTDYFYLEKFFELNQYIGVLKMENLNITDQCMERINAGLGKNVNNWPLKILSLGSNLLTEKSIVPLVSLISRHNLSQLNLSSNPLSPHAYLTLPSLRNSTLKLLDLSSTQMNSEALIHLLQQLLQTKNLQILKLDNNDFSHHWFNKIKDVFTSGLSIQYISMSNCGIKNFDCLMEGVMYSKYLKRLNLNYNLVNIEEEDIEKVSNCLKNNKVLQELRIRFCGYNQSILLKLISSLLQNSSLRVIDLSQNHLSDNGANMILQLLAVNTSIKQLFTQKLPLSVRMQERIAKCLQHNREIRHEQQFRQLIDQNQLYRRKQLMAWEDIYRMNEEGSKLQKAVQQAQVRNEKISNKIASKKEGIIEMKKQAKIDQKQFERDLKRQEQTVQSNIRKITEKISKTQETYQQQIEFLQIEKNLIRSLQQKIMLQNQKIKKRETQLQDQLRDQLYNRRKKQKSEREKMQKRQSIVGSQILEKSSLKAKNSSSQLFDNTKGMSALNKRKSSIGKKK